MAVGLSHPMPAAGSLPAGSLAGEVEGRIERPELWLVAGLTLLGLAVCLYRIGRADLWLDEAFSLAGSGDLARSWSDRGGSMGLYYSLLAVWADPDSSAGWVRLPSAVFAAATVPFVYLIARAVGGRRVATIAATLLVVSWGYVRYGQEARSYSMVMLLVTVSWWLFLRILTGARSLRWLAAQGAVIALVGYAQPLGLLAVVPQLLVAVLAERPASVLRRLVPAWLSAAVLSVPLAVLIFNAEDAGPSWVRPLNRVQFEQLHTQIGGTVAIGAWVLTAMITVGLVLSVRDTVASPASGRWLRGLPVVWFALPIVGLVAISLVEPYFVARYLLPITPAACVLAAVALARLPRPAAEITTLVLVGVLAVSVVRLWDHPREDWSGVVATVTGAQRPSTVLFADPELRVPFEHALLMNGDVTAVRPLMPPHEWGGLPRYLPDHSLSEMAPRLDGAEHLWIIDRGHAEGSDPRTGRAAQLLDDPALPEWCPGRSAWFPGGLIALELHTPGSEPGC
jgi:mannosyltransferase